MSGNEDEKDATAYINLGIPLAQATSTANNAVLLTIYPTGVGMGRRFELNKAETIIGRLDDLEISLKVDGISRKHARILRDHTGWWVEDLGSTNGTQVNDVTVSRVQLREGDLVRFGGAICKFLSGDNIEAAYHEEIYKLSIIDGLTGVHNKRFFLDFLERELRVSARQQTPLSLIMIDIDHFKKVNDTHGHLAGDNVLKEMCRRIKPRVRATDLIARYGGEEFAVVMPQTGREGGLQFAEVMRALVQSEVFLPGDIDLACTISLGLAEADMSNTASPEDLIKRADDNLYEAKRSGRNRAVG